MTFKEGGRAVVTGAASGMGEATARRLVAEGVDVLAVDVNADGMAASRRARRSSPTSATPTSARGSSRGPTASTTSSTRPRSSSSSRSSSSPSRTGAASSRSTPSRPSSSASRSARRCGRAGRSSTSPRPRPSSPSTIEAAPYAATKTAILSITRSFAYALAYRPIRVNAIVPGITNTPMQERVLDRPRRDPRHDAAGAERRARRDGAAEARRLLRRGGRRDLLPALGGGRLHHRREPQLRRRDGDVVKHAESRCVAEGLGHPEGPDVLPDGRVVFANTYASELGVWEDREGQVDLRPHRRRPERRACSARTAASTSRSARRSAAGSRPSSGRRRSSALRRTARSRSSRPRPTGAARRRRTTSPSAPTAASTSPTRATGTR